MKNFLFVVMACLALTIISCKPGTKEVAEVKPPDTTAVAPPPPAQPAPIDSAAIAAKYNEEHEKSMAKAPKKTPAPASKKVHTDPPIAVYEAGDDNVEGKHSDDNIYYYPSKWATFPGGEAALNKYLSDNLKYPKEAQDKGIEGTVYVDLSVDEMGNIVAATVVSKHIGYGLETEVLRVIKSMPKWNPGEYNHQSVKTKFTLPVIFDLKY